MSLSHQIVERQKLLIYLEVVIIFLVSLIVSIVRLDESLLEVLFDFPGQPKVLIYPLIWYLMLYLTDGWDKSKVLLSNKFFTDVFDAAWKSLLSFAALAYLANYPISRLWVLLNVATITLSLLLVRLAIRMSLRRQLQDLAKIKYIYIGTKAGSLSFQKEFRSLFGFKPGFLVLPPPGSEDSSIWISKYRKKIDNDIYGTVISYGAISDANLLKDLANFSRDKVIDLILVSRIAPIVKRFDILENPTLIRIQQSSLYASGAFLKRLLDIVGSIAGLIIFLPVFLLTALGVKMSSPGPILFTDRRVGKNGVVFTFPKFRSMNKGAEFRRADYIGKPDSEVARRYMNDPRITTFGRFIRRWSIDELPQLWCVLIGTMSLVGPRPILIEEQDLVDAVHSERFMAKPGLTGLWQVTGRKEVAWEDRMLRDLSYVENWSLWRDVIYIFKTLRAIIQGKGAY
jgi:exopolysaccharide biosynthesis polyprenyl glycosylphosphotransferase